MPDCACIKRILDTPWVLNMPKFWIRLGSEYRRVLDMQVLNSVLYIPEYALTESWIYGCESTIFHSILPLPPAQEHPDIYSQLWMWDDCHILLITPLLFTRLLLDEIYHLTDENYHLIDWWCDVNVLFVHLMIWF